jgi:hypothetical protein
MGAPAASLEEVLLMTQARNLIDGKRDMKRVQRSKNLNTLSDQDSAHKQQEEW